VLKDRLNNLKADRDRAKAALEATKSQIAPAIRIDPALIERFGRTMREKFTTGSVPFRKDVGRVRVCELARAPKWSRRRG
jgi:hypothetical protein